MSVETFTDSYLECLLWQATDESGAPMDNAYGVADLDSSARQATREDCHDFYVHNATSWHAAGLSDEQAGHDFCLTRNGHGAGFWDRGIGEVGTRLTEACRPYGTADLYVGDDGRLYVS
jgi:hypothetical protein